MFNASVRTWQGRLLFAGAVSMLVHALAALVASHAARPAAAPQQQRIVLRLHSGSPHKADQPGHAQASSAQPAVGVPAAPPQPQPQPLSHLAATPAPAHKASIPGIATGEDDSAETGGMPGRYRVRMPPEASLTYSVTSNRGGTPGSAHIVWQHAGDTYRLTVDGPLGTLSSTGHDGDTGIVPTEAREQRAGAEAVTRFDEAANKIVFSTGTRSYPINIGSQDRASVLMQLSGMGLAEPAQFSGQLEIFVAGAEDAAVARYKVVGLENVETGLGPLNAWHLVQLSRRGQRRVEVWLAPERSWYPVQLRVADPDGTVTTQLLQSVEPAPAS